MSQILDELRKNDLDTPCLIIDKGLLEFNLQVMRQHSLNTQVNIRPHVKTHKCSQLAKLQLEYGAIGISAAKVSEAEVLINKGINNILITSPVVTKNKIARLTACITKAPETIVVTDNARNLHDLNEAGASIQAKINILIDLDPGIGRTGIKATDALNFAFKIAEFKWLNLMGVQCYAGNLQHISAYQERKERSLQIMETASKVVRQLKEAGHPCPILTGAGTGTYDIDIDASEITEIQPGSYAVMDVEYGRIGSKKDSDAFTIANP